MPDYRKMTVASLRALAREVLGPGHAKKTKAELVALLEAPPAGKPAAARSVARAPSAPARSAAERTPSRPTRKAGTAAPPDKAEAAAAPSDEGTPGAEGYFVARVRGEEAVREAPHPLTETASDAPPGAREVEARPAAPDEGLGELPWGYGDDAFMALPRDPRTLFLFWDFAAATTSAALAGLDGPRVELHILARAGDGWERVRTVDFALESRGYYVHDLEPGRVYRAEIQAVDRRGTARLVGRSSNEMMLPPLGPSPVIDDRFIRIPWDMPLGRLLGPGHPGGPFSDEARALLARLSDWSRFGGGGGSIGGIGGRGPPNLAGGSGMGGSGAGRGA